MVTRYWSSSDGEADGNAAWYVDFLEMDQATPMTLVLKIMNCHTCRARVLIIQ